MFLSFSQFIESNYSWVWFLSYNVVNITEARCHTLIKTDLVFPSSYQMPVFLTYGSVYVPTLCFHAGIFVWLGLALVLHCCELICAWALLCLKTSFLKIIHHPWLLLSFYSHFSKNPWHLREWVRYVLSIYRWALWSLLFSTCWLFVGVCVHCHLLKELPW